MNYTLTRFNRHIINVKSDVFYPRRSRFDLREVVGAISAEMYDTTARLLPATTVFLRGGGVMTVPVPIDELFPDQH